MFASLFLHAVRVLLVHLTSCGTSVFQTLSFRLLGYWTFTSQPKKFTNSTLPTYLMLLLINGSFQMHSATKILVHIVRGGATIKVSCVISLDPWPQRPQKNVNLEIFQKTKKA